MKAAVPSPVRREGLGHLPQGAGAETQETSETQASLLASESSPPEGAWM